MKFKYILMKNLTKRIFFISSFILLYSPILFAQQDSKAGQILDEVSKKYKAIPSFKAGFSILRESPNSGKANETDNGEITVKGSKFHLKLKDQEIYNNSAKVWTYLRTSNEVTINNYSPDDDELNPTKIFTVYKKGFKYSLAGEEKEAGQVYDVIDLSPEKAKNQQVYKIKLIINKKDKSLKRWRVFEKNGNRYTYTITNFTPVTLEDKDFVFDKTKYKGVEEVALDN